MSSITIYFKCHKLDWNTTTNTWQGTGYTANTDNVSGKNVVCIFDKSSKRIKTFDSPDPIKVDDVFIDGEGNVTKLFNGRDSSGKTLQSYIDEMCPGGVTPSPIDGEKPAVIGKIESNPITVPKNIDGSTIKVWFPDGRGNKIITNCKIVDKAGIQHEITFDLAGKKYKATFSAQPTAGSIVFQLVFQGDVPVQIHGQDNVYSPVEIGGTAAATTASKDLTSDALLRKLAGMGKEGQDRADKWSGLLQNANEEDKVKIYKREIEKIEAAEKGKKEKAEVDKISKELNKVEADLKRMLSGRTNNELIEEIATINSNDLKKLVAILNKSKTALDDLWKRIELLSRDNKNSLSVKYLTLTTTIIKPLMDESTKCALKIAKNIEQAKKAGAKKAEVKVKDAAKTRVETVAAKVQTDVAAKVDVEAAAAAKKAAAIKIAIAEAKALEEAAAKIKAAEAEAKAASDAAAVAAAAAKACREKKENFYGLIGLEVENPSDEDKKGITDALQEWVDEVNKAFGTYWPKEYSDEHAKMLEVKTQAHSRIDAAIAKASRAREAAAAQAAAAAVREPVRELPPPPQPVPLPAPVVVAPVAPPPQPAVAPPPALATVLPPAATAPQERPPDDKRINELEALFFSTISDSAANENLESATSALQDAFNHLRTKILEEYKTDDEAKLPSQMSARLDNARLAMTNTLRAISQANSLKQTWMETTFSDQAIFEAINDIGGYKDQFIKTKLEQNADGSITLRIFIDSERDKYDGTVILEGFAKFIKERPPLSPVPCNMYNVPDQFQGQRITKDGSWYVSLWLKDYLAQLRSYKVVIGSRRKDLSPQEQSSIENAVSQLFGKPPAKVTWDSDGYQEMTPGTWEDLVDVLKHHFPKKLEERKLDKDIIVAEAKSETNNSLLLVVADKDNQDKKIAVITLSPTEFREFTKILINSIREKNFRLHMLLATLSEKNHDAENTGEKSFNFYNAYKAEKKVSSPKLKISKGVEDIPQGYIRIYIIPTGIALPK